MRPPKSPTPHPPVVLPRLQYPPEVETQAVRLAEERAIARKCLADMLSQLSISRRDSSNDPGTPSPPISPDILEPSAAARAVIHTASADVSGAGSSRFDVDWGRGAEGALVLVLVVLVLSMMFARVVEGELERWVFRFPT